MNAKLLWFLLTGENFGLLSQLLQQSGNGGTGLKIRMLFNGITSGGEYQGSYSAAATYAAADIIGYPSDTAPLRYRANQSTTAGQSPDTNPEKWDLEVGLDVIQDIGSGKYARYLLGIRNDDMVRLNGIERGTYATTAFNRKNSNYSGFRATSAIGTASTSFATPGSHPSARTLPTAAGLVADLPDSETLSGTCVDTFSIPTITPTFLTLTLPTGLTLTAGETITLYGNASNFVVVVVARYNSVTGAFYGASTNSVGTGSFSSWSIKRERLVYIYDTTDPTGKNFYGLVQTYDNGTGSLVVNSVANVSTTTNADWTIAIAKQPTTPTATLSTFFNNSVNTAYALGHWMLGTFTGDKLQHRSETSTAGMDWEYVYLTGPDQASPPANVTVSTYSASPVSLVDQNVFTGLTKGTHTFLAISKAAASGTNTRAWVYADTDDVSRTSFNEQYEYDVFTADITAGPTGGESYGELAYKFRDTDGGDTTQWLPEHSNVKTTTGRNRTFTIDGVVVDHTDENDPYMLKYVDFSTASLVQSLSIIHPQATGSMGTMAVTHSFSNQGLYYRVAITWAQAGLIETGYNNMAFLGHAWFNKVLCQDLQVITRPADNTSVNLSATEKDQASYLFYSTGADPLDKFVLAQYWPNPTRDWRIGGANPGTPFIQDFAGSANAKWYPYVYLNYSFGASEVMTIEGRLYAGNKGTLVLS